VNRHNTCFDDGAQVYNACAFACSSCSLLQVSLILLLPLISTVAPTLITRTMPLLPSILTPSRAPSNFSITSSRKPKLLERIIPIEFPSGWGYGDVFEWSLRRQSSTITRIELRKEFDSFQHEYVLIIFNDGYTCRIDRRPHPNVPIDSLMRKGCQAIDTIEEILQTSTNPSQCVVRLDFDQDGLDITIIVLILFAIKHDHAAQRYTLQKFNCYFMAWTILLLVSRYSQCLGPADTIANEMRRVVEKNPDFIDILEPSTSAYAWRLPISFRWATGLPDEITEHLMALADDVILDELSGGGFREAVVDSVVDVVARKIYETMKASPWQVTGMMLKGSGHSWDEKFQQAIVASFRTRLLARLPAEYSTAECVWVISRSTKSLARRLEEWLETGRARSRGGRDSLLMPWYKPYGLSITGHDSTVSHIMSPLVITSSPVELFSQVGSLDMSYATLQILARKHIRLHAERVDQYRLGSRSDIYEDVTGSIARVWRSVVEIDGVVFKVLN
jgi:hypothetical protein